MKPSAKCGVCVGAVVALVSIILFACSWATLSPTQLGLLHNTITGTVDTSRVYGAGRYFVWLGHSFVVVPGNAVTMLLSNNATADAPPVTARTGATSSHTQSRPRGSSGAGSSGGGNDSGGQPVNISLSFQYQFAAGDVPFVYTQFGTNYVQRFVSYTRQAVTDVAQTFIPKDFWQQRARVVRALHKALNASLYANAKAQVLSVQLLRVEFAPKFESQVVKIQEQIQQTRTNTYQKQVTTELKDLDIIRAVNSANITVIQAGAEAEATIILNQAQAAGFRYVQRQKATSFRAMRSQLFRNDTAALVRYLKLQALASRTAASASTSPSSQAAMTPTSGGGGRAPAAALGPGVVVGVSSPTRPSGS